MNLTLPVRKLRSAVSSTCALVAVVMATHQQPLSAATISWGSSIGATMVQSDGSAVDSTFQFELGYFGNIGGNPLTPFVPTASNVNEWATYWNPWDIATTTNNGYSVGLSYVSRSLAFDGNSTADVDALYGQNYTIPGNALGYIWVYNDKNISTDSEWALITNKPGDSGTGSDWRFPDPLDGSVAPLDDWRFETAGTAVLGGFENVQGPGQYSASPGVFELQTSAVPEPGSALLILTTGLAFQMGRRRMRWKQ